MKLIKEASVKFFKDFEQTITLKLRQNGKKLIKNEYK